MEFDLRFLDESSRTFLQHAIDGVNRAAVLHDPGAWNFVSAGGLIQANKDMGYKKVSEMDPIATTIFDVMGQDGHSGYTAGWTIHAVTEVAKNYRLWRDSVLENCLSAMKKELNAFIDRRFAEKFPEEGNNVDWFVKKEKVLHELEYSYLVRHIIEHDERQVLQYLLKMESVSHLGNDVLFDQIEEQLRIL